ncbi:MAG: hypothetical protein AMXMBFR64_13040 [Myxococcales bacterium]
MTSPLRAHLCAALVLLAACDGPSGFGGLADDSAASAAHAAPDGGGLNSAADANATGGAAYDASPGGAPSVDAALGDASSPGVRWSDPWAGDPGGVSAFYTYDPADLFALPFPHDARRLPGGGLDLRGFPNPKKVEVLQGYIDYASRDLGGFSANGAIYVRFEGPIELTRLPEPEQSTAAESLVWLVDVGNDPATRGRRVPIEWRWHGDELSVYEPDNLLAVRPVYGFPLAEGGTYALVVMRDLRDAAGALLGVPAPVREALTGEPDGALGAALEPLRAFCDEGGLNPYGVAVATVFTVDRFSDELVAARAVAQTIPAPVAKGVKQTGAKGGYALYEGTYVGPNFQHGEKPYETDGGGFLVDAEGRPLIHHMETIRFALSVPDGPAPEEGWPVVLFGHGTGGNFKNFLGGAHAPATVLAAEGIAVLGIDQPLHGTRWDGNKSQLDFLSFNFLNLDAGRSNFRQSAADFFTLVRLVRESVVVPGKAAQGGVPVQFDPERVYYFGHSHGGLAGALLGAVEPNLRGAVLSGAGGGLAMTIMLRKDPYDFLSLVGTMLGATPQELTTFHPVITLVQTLVDVTDPINYAPYHVGGELRGGTPLDLLVTQGQDDVATPSITTEAMAAAAGLPVLAPPVHMGLGLALAKVPLVDLPVPSLLHAANGASAAGLLAQFPGYGHHVAFQNPAAAALWASMLSSSAYGPETVIR